jgi:hypothetical protein
MASPRETSLVIWVYERAEGLMDQDEDSLSQITAKKDSQEEEDIPLDGTCLRDKTNKTKECAAVVSTSNIDDYLQHIYIYEQ